MSEIFRTSCIHCSIIKLFLFFQNRMGITRIHCIIIDKEVFGTHFNKKVPTSDILFISKMKLESTENSHSFKLFHDTFLVGLVSCTVIVWSKVLYYITS